MLRIYRPVKFNWITQKFGENKACAKTGPDGRAIRPFVVKTEQSDGTCEAGYTKLYPLLGLKGHNGYDLAAPHGAPLYHSGDYEGWMKTEVDANGGVGVDIISNEKLLTDNTGEAHYIKLRYWHLKSVVGHDGKKIVLGDLIGYVDNTGISSGDHVHFALKLCTQEGRAINRDNGYYGSVDKTRYYQNTFVIEILDDLKRQIESLAVQIRSLILVVKRLLKGRN